MFQCAKPRIKKRCCIPLNGTFFDTLKNPLYQIREVFFYGKCHTLWMLGSCKKKVYEALPADEEIRKTSRANAGFERINQLFDLEREYSALSPEERYAQRQERSRKVPDDFYAWLETVNPSQGTGLAKAVQYARNEKSYLYAFLEDPQIPIDNNLAERSVKPFVIGRKNWLFSTSPKGADASAVAYSIINTAQANGIDVKEYLTNIFRTGERRLPLKFE